MTDRHLATIPYLFTKAVGKMSPKAYLTSGRQWLRVAHLVRFHFVSFGVSLNCPLSGKQRSIRVAESHTAKTYLDLDSMMGTEGESRKTQKENLLKFCLI
jgi:hypothetical protein